MAAVDMRADLSLLFDAVASGNHARIVATARDYLQQDRAADVLLGRLGMVVAHGDQEGHRTITVAAATMLSRLLHWIPAPVDAQEPPRERALPLFVQALKVAAPVFPAGLEAITEGEAHYPLPFFPSELVDTDKTISRAIHEAIMQNDPQLIERILLGFYSTGADYRTLQLYAYEAVADIFQNGGHPLLYTVHGFQLLDAVEWGKQVPNIIHWLAPHLSLRSEQDEPVWQKPVRDYIADPAHSVASVRTRLATADDSIALPLRALILSDAPTRQICQGIYDTLITRKASPLAVGSVITQAAADILQRVDESNAERFTQAAHGLLFTSAVTQALQQIQSVTILGLLFTAAAYINALHKEFPGEKRIELKGIAGARGGLIAASQLETLQEQLLEQDLEGAYATALRYVKLGHDPRALFGTIGLIAARIDVEQDQGHTLQLVQATADAYQSWPQGLANISIDVLLQIALRASIAGPRDSVIEQL